MMLTYKVGVMPFGHLTINIGRPRTEDDRSQPRPKKDTRYFVPRETASGTYEVFYDRDSSSYSDVEYNS